MKKNRGDEPIGVIICIYMEISGGNSLCSYLKQTKMSFFYLQHQRIGGWNRSCLSDTSGSMEVVRKGCRRVSMVQILCTHVCKYKNDTYDF
jgi:hypothetical protein